MIIKIQKFKHKCVEMRLINKKISIPHILLFTILIISFFLLIEPSVRFEVNHINERISDDRKSINQSANSERIFISNNWSAAESAGICSGSGTYLDPYVIRDKVINGNGSGSGIAIISRNDYFRIENCTVFNCSVGVDLFSTDNGTLYNNNCSLNNVGIYLHCPSKPSPDEYGCFNNSIIGNIANSNSWQGIYLGWSCEDNIIINNTANNNIEYGINFEGHPEIIISGNTANNNRVGLNIMGLGNKSELSKNIALDNINYGIYCSYLSGWNLKKNIMEGSGLSYQCSSIEAISQMNIDTTNTVNGGPIYLYVNETNLTPNDFTNAGQIILGNCTGVLIKDVDVSNSSNGISICHSNNVIIDNCVSSNNLNGINLRNTNNSIIIGNILENNMENKMDGINNTITGNYLYNHLYGMDFGPYDNNNTILDNEFINNYWGLRFWLNSYNTISGNIFKDNLYGIGVLPGAEYNLFYENFFRGNFKHIEGDWINNDWNNTQIGNYWDNYTGTDENNDGIGDTPYNITQSPLKQDFLPIVDNQAPDLTIIFPKNNTEFNQQAPSFTLHITERFLDKMWYTLGGGLQNFSFTINSTINQVAWDALSDGSITVRFYAVDKIGNLSFKDVIVKKVSPSESIPGYNLIIFIGITLSFCSLVVKVRNRKRLIIYN